MPLAIVIAVTGLLETTLGQNTMALDPHCQAFFKQHCTRCHNSQDKSADLDLELGLPLNFAARSDRQRWLEVLNVLNSHEMPPKDEPQPNADEVARVTDWITNQVVAAEQRLRSGEIVLRRLNRNQYRRTISDLFGIDYDVSHFPLDSTAGGFDNNGGALSLSPTQLELYLDAAREIVDRALVTGDQPASIRWRFEPESGDSDSNRVNYDGQRAIVNGGKNRLEGNFRVMHHDSWDRHLNARDFQLPTGDYIVRIRAGGKIPSRAQVVESALPILQQRYDEQVKQNPKREKWSKEELERTLEHFRQDRDYDYGPPRLRLIQDWKGQPRTVAEFDIDASVEQPAVVEFRTRFPGGKTGLTLEYAYSVPKELENFWFQNHDAFARPEAWVDWFEIEGPLYESWPPPSHQRWLPAQSASASEQEYVQACLKKFMSFAYRRPATAEEVAGKLELYQAARTQDPTAPVPEVIKPALIAVLVSPNFLFLAEPEQDLAGPDKPKQSGRVHTTTSLSDFELATRLSYFLWSSMPDADLLRAAATGQLRNVEVLRSQVRRMIADPKSDALVEDFAGQWLGLREIGANPPAADLYREYDRHLETSIRQESLAFFREILRNDLSVRNFLKSDFVMVNERLARFYELKQEVRGDQFRRVAVSEQEHRGGIVTQASMLSITSNGTRTSPVKRGTWLLKNLLGTDPGLPVANAGDIAPKVPGIDKATVRKRLEIHRELPQCARCHNKIDPLGFALENFDASGKYRQREGFGYQGRIERNDPLIDASAQLPDGTQIHGVDQLQDVMLEREDLFLRCLASKLWTYALGREATLGDQPEIHQIVAQCKANHYTLRSMIEAIVTSKAFAER